MAALVLVLFFFGEVATCIFCGGAQTYGPVYYSSRPDAYILSTTTIDI